MRLGQRWLDVHTLEETLCLPPALFAAGVSDEPHQQVLFIIQTPGGGPAAVRVPDPGPARQGLVREWAGYMPRVPGIDGAAILGDGSLAPVLDLPELVSTMNGQPADLRLPAQAAEPLPLCLVVDDSISVRKATVQFLADLGFATDTAGDGAEALRRVARRRPDLVLVDLEMPVMDGLEMTRALRQLPDCADIPVIMIKSRSSARYRPMAMAAGANHFLAKPFSEDELGALVAGLLG
ncbi:MAG: response regulator [Burkholderiaceae bacterium]